MSFQNHVIKPRTVEKKTSYFFNRLTAFFHRETEGHTFVILEDVHKIVEAVLVLTLRNVDIPLKNPISGKWAMLKCD